MPNISLRPITAANWRAVCRLEVAEEQRDFVAPNWYSLLEAHYGFAGEQADLPMVPLAIYEREEPVGLVMYNVGPEEDRYFIMRLMIDRRAQRRGCGRAAMEELIGRFRSNARTKEVGVSYVPGNAIAAKLYRSLGFEEVGLDEEGAEMVAVLTLKGQEEPWESLWR
jgi:diamine N-acetyltransferase